MLDRLRNGEGGEAGAALAELRQECVEPVPLVRGQPVVPLDQAGVPVVEQGRQVNGKAGEALVGHARRQEVVDVGRERKLELGVLGEESRPVVEVAARVNKLAQPFAAVAHQQPAAPGVQGHQLGDVAGDHPLEDRQQPRLEGVRRGVCLEPERSLGCRDPKDGRPPAHVGLFDLSGQLDSALVDPVVDPGDRLGEPLGLDPWKARIGGNDARHSVRA